MAQPKQKTERLTFDDFDISAQSEEGVVVNLVHPKTGKETNEWIKILGADSKRFREAQATFNQDRLSFLRGETKKKSSVKDQLEFETSAERKLVASLVTDWSLTGKDGKKVPCTQENVIQFFEKAPQIQEQVDKFSGDRRNFSSPSLTN